MIPLRTTYRVAAAPADYRRCRALMRAVGVAPMPLSYPTVMAERDGGLVGFLSTDTKKGTIIANSLVLRDRSMFVAIRLIEAYDAVMRKAGVQAYHFHVDAQNARWRSAIERFGLQPWHEDAQGAWFRRTLAA